MSRDGLIERYLAAVPHTRSEVFAKPSPIIDVSGCERRGDLTRPYAGISPSWLPQNGKPPGQQNIRKRPHH